MAIETVLRTNGVCTTILGVMNQFQAFTDLEYNVMLDTTLNKKYDVLSTLTPPTTPALKYFGIGTRGFKNIDTEQSSMPYPGDARCMDLYSPIPIRCIPIDEEEDVLGTDRNKYRMRVVKSINGITYACYYLKVIEFDRDVTIVKKDANGDESPFVLDTSWLTPNPPQVNQVGGNIDTNINRILIRATGVCKVTHDEIMEAVSAMYNNDSAYARISELGYYTGCEVPVTKLGEVITDEALITDETRYEAAYVQLAKMHCFRGSELFTSGSYIQPTVCLESECCINGTIG